MKNILELVSRLKADKYKFTFDGSDTFEFPFGELKITMFVEYDDDNERPILIQYHTVIDDDDLCDAITIDENTVDNWDSDSKTYLDLNIEDVIIELEQFVENVKERNVVIVKIQKHIDEIEKLIGDDETYENVVHSLIQKSNFSMNF